MTTKDAETRRRRDEKTAPPRASFSSSLSASPRLPLSASSALAALKNFRVQPEAIRAKYLQKALQNPAFRRRGKHNPARIEALAAENERLTRELAEARAALMKVERLSFEVYQPQVEAAQAACAAMLSIVKEFASHNPQSHYNGVMQDPMGVYALLAMPNPGQPLLDKLRAYETATDGLEELLEDAASALAPTHWKPLSERCRTAAAKLREARHE